MTEPKATPAELPAQDSPNPAADPPEPQDTEHTDPEPEPTPNSEAARYRVERNEARAERDSLRERITGYQRRECEAAVADLLDEPADLFEVGMANVTEFYNDDGELNEGELRAAAGALCEMRPKLAKPRGPRWQDFGQGSKPPPQRGIGWDTVLKQ